MGVILSNESRNLDYPLSKNITKAPIGVVGAHARTQVDQAKERLFDLAISAAQKIKGVGELDLSKQIYFEPRPWIDTEVKITVSEKTYEGKLQAFSYVDSNPIQEPYYRITVGSPLYTVAVSIPAGFWHVGDSEVSVMAVKVGGDGAVEAV